MRTRPRTASGKPLPTRYEGPRESPGYLLWIVSNTWQRAVREALQPMGLTHTQFVALAVACWNEDDEPLTQSRLSLLAGSDPMTVSQVVRALEKAGYFTRVAHPADLRARVIRPTDAGRRLAAKALVAVEKTDGAFFAPLRSECGTLVDLLRRLSPGVEA